MEWPIKHIFQIYENIFEDENFPFPVVIVPTLSITVNYSHWFDYITIHIPVPSVVILCGVLSYLRILFYRPDCCWSPVSVIV